MAYFNSLGFSLKRLWLAFAVGLFALQTGSLVYYASQAADSRPVIAGLDNDASNAIDVAGRSRWFLDNGFSPYGPVYFRIAHSLAWFLPDLQAPGQLSAAVAQTKTEHFALLLVSVLALQGLALLLASLATSEPFLLFLIASVFSRLLQDSEAAREMLLRAHPDHLLTFFTALAVALGLRFWRHPHDERLFRASAWAWGVAMATKLSLTFFMPFVFAPVIILAEKGRKIRTAAIYLLHMLAAYFLIGFIQNLNVPRTLRFLKSQSAYSSRGNYATVLDWLHIWFTQVQGPLIFALLLTIYGFWRRPAWPSRNVVLMGAGLALGPFVILMMQAVNAPHAHYVMPIVAAQLVLLLGMFARPIAISRGRYAIPLVLLVTAGFGHAKLTAPGLNAMVDSQRECRVEAREVFEKIQALASGGKTIYADPYVPTMDHTAAIKSIWKADIDYIEREKFDVLVLNRRIADQYLFNMTPERRSYVQNFNPDADATAKFYGIFINHEEVDDPRLGKWKKTFSNHCPWQIWEK